MGKMCCLDQIHFHASSDFRPRLLNATFKFDAYLCRGTMKRARTNFLRLALVFIFMQKSMAACGRKGKDWNLSLNRTNHKPSSWYASGYRSPVTCWRRAASSHPQVISSWDQPTESYIFFQLLIIQTNFYMPFLCIRRSEKLLKFIVRTAFSKLPGFLYLEGIKGS